MTASETAQTAGQNLGVSVQSQIASRLSLFARDIKIHHTVFALPFALLSTFMAARGLPPVGVLILILICMVSARTVAMSANRLLDARLDALNPRTAARAIPAGRLSRTYFVAALTLCAGMFLAATAVFQIRYHNPWPLALALPVLAFISVYPLLKRFTRLCHYYLGAALALAPVCAWVAVRGDLALPSLLMFLAVLFWTAGFDIIYACQDYQVDVRCGLFSVPAKLGVGRALWVARATHVVSLAALVLLGLSSPLLGSLYFAGAGLSLLLLIAEHALVKESDLSRLGVAFFAINATLSVLVGTLGSVDVFLRR